MCSRLKLFPRSVSTRPAHFHLGVERARRLFRVEVWSIFSKIIKVISFGFLCYFIGIIHFSIFLRFSPIFYVSLVFFVLSFLFSFFVSFSIFTVFLYNCFVHTLYIFIELGIPRIPECMYAALATMTLSQL